MSLARFSFRSLEVCTLDLLVGIRDSANGAPFFCVVPVLPHEIFESAYCRSEGQRFY